MHGLHGLHGLSARTIRVPDFATRTTPEGKVVAHAHVDGDAAALTIEWIRAVMAQPRVKVIMAHDTEWYAENKENGQWPAVIPSL